jgi:hypothetical protein
LFKFKSKIPDLDPGEGENFNHKNTLSISRINPPKFGGGIKFEPYLRGIGFAFHRASAELGQKGGIQRSPFILAECVQ